MTSRSPSWRPNCCASLAPNSFARSRRSWQTAKSPKKSSQSVPMLKVILSLFSLLLGIGCLLVGLGALSTLLGVRAGIEQFGPEITGVVMAGYFLGFIVGNYLCPPLIWRVG